MTRPPGLGLSGWSGRHHGVWLGVEGRDREAELRGSAARTPLGASLEEESSQQLCSMLSHKPASSERSAQSEYSHYVNVLRVLFVLH